MILLLGEGKLIPKFSLHRLYNIKNYKKVYTSAMKPLANVAGQVASCCAPAMLASGFLGNLYVH